MKTGRPIKSDIRDNIIKLLSKIGKAHGYKIYKEYLKQFPKCTLRNIYYHLHKGKELGLFSVTNEKIDGDYSWGKDAEIICYELKFSNKIKGDIEHD